MAVLPGLSRSPQASISFTSLFCTFLDQDEDNDGDGVEGEDGGDGGDGGDEEEDDLKIKNQMDINSDLFK